jgi:hypothetical protein
MPAEYGLGLNNDEGLFPATHRPRQQHQEQSIRLGTHWALHLTVQDHELLTEQCIFCNQLRLAPSQISNSGEEY